MRSAVAGLILVASVAASAAKPYRPPTIAERHAAYAQANQARPTRGSTLRLIGVAIFREYLFSLPFERRAERRSNQHFVETIITAGELRVERLGMPREEVRRQVQLEIDRLRETDRIVVPENLLGLQ